MTTGLFEVVPNISEGRDPAIVAACAEALASDGARVVHRTSDPVHHRSVLTAIGSGSQVVAGAVALAAAVRERIDLRRHRGAHPRIGALDVLPFVPLRDATLDDAITLAHRAAARIWRETGIPAYLYGAAAQHPSRTLLAFVRRGQFEALAIRARTPEGAFDFGDAAHPSAGAIAVGARPILVAFNVELASENIGLARRIAATIRERGGGLRTLRALGIALENGHVQVSCNITDVAATPLHVVVEAVRGLAAAEGVALARSELVGLAPEAAIVTAARAYGD